MHVSRLSSEMDPGLILWSKFCTNGFPIDELWLQTSLSLFSEPGTFLPWSWFIEVHCPAVDTVIAELQSMSSSWMNMFQGAECTFSMWWIQLEINLITVTLVGVKVEMLQHQLIAFLQDSWFDKRKWEIQEMLTKCRAHWVEGDADVIMCAERSVIQFRGAVQCLRIDCRWHQQQFFQWLLASHHVQWYFPYPIIFRCVM